MYKKCMQSNDVLEIKLWRFYSTLIPSRIHFVLTNLIFKFQVCQLPVCWYQQRAQPANIILYWNIFWYLVPQSIGIISSTLPATCIRFEEVTKHGFPDKPRLDRLHNGYHSKFIFFFLFLFCKMEDHVLHTKLHAARSRRTNTYLATAATQPARLALGYEILASCNYTLETRNAFH